MQWYYNTERRKGKHLTNEYSPDKAQELYRENRRKKQGNLKITKNIELSKYIEDSIVNKKNSPYVTLENAKKEGQEVNICLRTLYNYIEKELFIELTKKHLPYNKKGRYKRKRIEKLARKYPKTFSKRFCSITVDN